MNNSELSALLTDIGLDPLEAVIYLALLRSNGATHLELSRETGVNRSKVYRIIDDLCKQSLAHITTDDKGKRIHAADPEVLSVSVLDQKQEAAKKQEALECAMPSLTDIVKNKNLPLNFKVNTYSGVEGFKQMLWNELKAKGEVLIIGSGSLENLVDNHAWAEKHRSKSKEKDYKVREIKGSNDKSKKGHFTDIKGYLDNSEIRYIDESIVDFKHQIVIYNSTVSTYCYSDGQKVGLEIVNTANADFYRDMFERYWLISK